MIKKKRLRKKWTASPALLTVKETTEAQGLLPGTWTAKGTAEDPGRPFPWCSVENTAWLVMPNSISDSSCPHAAPCRAWRGNDSLLTGWPSHNLCTVVLHPARSWEAGRGSPGRLKGRAPVHPRPHPTLLFQEILYKHILFLFIQEVEAFKGEGKKNP